MKAPPTNPRQINIRIILWRTIINLVLNDPGKPLRHKDFDKALPLSLLPLSLPSFPLKMCKGAATQMELEPNLLTKSFNSPSGPLEREITTQLYLCISEPIRSSPLQKTPFYESE